jgi:hypothetical protein
MPPPTRSAMVARPLQCTPSPRASSSGLALFFFIGCLLTPNAWAPSPKQPPQHELNEIARAHCCPRCSELTRRAGLGGRQRQVAAEAAADVTSVRKIIALTSSDKKNNRTHPPSQNKRKRAWAVSPTMCRSRVTRLNGRQRAMGRGRCRWQMCHGWSVVCVCVKYKQKVLGNV